VGAVAIGWDDAEDTHYAWRLTPDMAFYAGTEAASRVDLSAAPSTAWDNASVPARPVVAELWEKLFIVDAVPDYSARNTLLSLDANGTVLQQSYVLGAGPAQPMQPYTAEEYNGVLFVAGYGTEDASDGDRPEYVRHSFLGRSPDAADGFDIDAWAIIGAVGQRVTAMKKGRGVLLVAKEQELYRMAGFGRAYPGWQYQIEQVSNTQGLGASNAYALTFAEGYWYGLGAGGPFRTDGYTVDVLVSPRLTDFAGISQRQTAWVAYHPARRMVLFGVHPASVPSGRSATYPFRVWAWDIDRQVWAPDWVPGFDVHSAGTVVTSAAQGPSAAPSAPATSSATTSGFTAGWTNGDVSALTEYWERLEAGPSVLTGTEAVTVASKVRTGLDPRQNYYWKVRHRKNGVTSAFATETLAQTKLAPPILAAVGDNASNKVKVTTTNPHSASVTVRVERSPAGAAAWTEVLTLLLHKSGKVASYDVSASCGVDYDYRALCEDLSWAPGTQSVYSSTVTDVTACEGA